MRVFQNAREATCRDILYLSAIKYQYVICGQIQEYIPAVDVIRGMEVICWTAIDSNTAPRYMKYIPYLDINFLSVSFLLIC